MISRILNVLLVLAIAVGGVLAWRSGEERSRLTKQYRRLARITGDFAIDDPSKLYYLALDTGEPFHFAWRVYLPPKYRQVLKHNGGHESSMWSDGAVQALARVRIRENEQGQYMIYTQMPGGSSLMGLGDKALADLLRDRWDEVRVEQLGKDGVAVVEPDGSAVLLRLTLPDAIQAEARKTLSSYVVDEHVPDVVEIKLDPDVSGP